MSRLNRLGRAFTSCVGKSQTVGDEELEKPRKIDEKHNDEDKQELLDLPDVLLESFYERVQMNAVVVEFLDCHGDQITGYVCVRNDAFQKRVVGRYTTNNWQSYEEVEATWLGSVEGENTDKFRFKITNLGPSYTMQLAVLYEVQDQQHWDNNNYHNYKIIYGQ